MIDGRCEDTVGSDTIEKRCQKVDCFWTYKCMRGAKTDHMHKKAAVLKMKEMYYKSRIHICHQ